MLAATGLNGQKSLSEETNTSVKTYKSASVIAAIVIGLGACSSAGLGAAASTNHAPPENTTSPVDALSNPAHPGLEGCQSNVSPNDLADALEIGTDFRESCHELIVCGGLATSLGSAVVNVLLRAALGGSSIDVTYKGKGTYTFGSGTDGGAGTSMDIVTRLGSDTSFGKTGDIIDFSLLDVASYFSGAKVTASAKFGTSGTSYGLGITFTGTGPGLELLGLGATPVSPFSVDSDKVRASLGKILIETHIKQDDKKGHAVFAYDVAGASQPLSALLDGDATPFLLTGLTGGRADLGQTMTVSQWQINYLDTGSSGFMNGTLGFKITGGKLPFSATFNYPNRKTPDVTLSCN